MCPACWDLRSKVVVDQTSKPSTAIFTASLVLGCVSLIPLPVVMIVSFVVGIIAIVQSRGPMAHQRWKGLVGLGLTVASGLFWIVLVLFFAARESNW